MSCARSIINEFCTGYPPETKGCEAINFVPVGNASMPVKAVEECRADWTNRGLHFAAVRDFFEKRLSMGCHKGSAGGVKTWIYWNLICRAL